MVGNDSVRVEEASWMRGEMSSRKKKNPRKSSCLLGKSENGPLVFQPCAFNHYTKLPPRLSAVHRKTPSFSHLGDEEHRQNVAAAAAAAARPQPLAGERGEGMPRHRRNRLVALRRSQQAEEAAEEEEDGAEPAEFQASGKIGAKKQRKLEEKQARKAQREAEEAEREERRKVEQKRDEERRLEEEQLRQEEERKEEELKKAKEEEEQREYEEYLKLKEGFVVEEEGMDEAMTEEQTRSFVTELLDYIKNAKVVLLEDLASHLGLRTQDAINRVQDLMADGTLTGVIDDRGKFIYITPQELTAVAEFIRRRGRVSITELAQESNSLINLQTEAGFLSQRVG